VVCEKWKGQRGRDQKSKISWVTWREPQVEAVSKKVVRCPQDLTRGGDLVRVKVRMCWMKVRAF
jgi:hypothetical protein